MLRYNSKEAKVETCCNRLLDSLLAGVFRIEGRESSEIELHLCNETFRHNIVNYCPFCGLFIKDDKEINNG